MSLADEAKLEYVFDPDKFGKKDLTLTTENHKLEPEVLLAYGKLATKLRLEILEQSEQLQKEAGPALKEQETEKGAGAEEEQEIKF